MMIKNLFILFFLLIPQLCFAKTIQVLHGGPLAINTTTSTFNNIASQAGSNTTETIRQNLASPAGMFTNLRVKLSVDPANGAGTQSVTFTLRVAGAGTALGCTISEGSTTCIDTDSVSVTAGQRLGFNQTAANTPAASNIEWTVEFIATSTADSFIFGGPAGTNLSTSATQYVTPSPNAGYQTTSIAASSPIPVSGTLKNLYVELLTAPANGAGTQSYTFKLYVNDSASIITCTISEAATTCNDLSNTVSINAGDTLSMESVPAGTPSAFCKMKFGVTITADVEGEFPVMMSKTQLTSTLVEEEIASYGGLHQGGNWSGTETNVDQPTNKMVVKAMYVAIDTDPGVGKSWTVTLNDDTSATAQTCVISSGSTSCNFTTTAVEVLVDSQMDYAVVPSNTPPTTRGAFGIAGYKAHRIISIH